MPPTEPDLKGYRLGEFVFEERIGGGGFGSVWRCEQPSLRRHIAIKVLYRDGATAKERFLREAHLASQLDHANAAHVYAFGIDEEIGFWIAMELLSGIGLDKWLAEHRRMPPEQLAPFILDLAGAVAAAHRHGIVHRDLKPANVMVCERDGRLVPKLLDLGIAREGVHAETIPDERELSAEVPSGDATEVLLDASPRVTTEALLSAAHLLGGQPFQGLVVAQVVRRITGEGVHLGTRLYMAPEQWDNPAAVGHTADQYALGVIVFELLTGRVPFNSDDFDELRAKHQLDRVPPLDLQFSPEVNRVVQRALSKEPSGRYRTVLEFAKALAAALRALPQGQVRALAEVWDGAGRPASLLLRGRNLLHMEGGGEIERAFLATSRRAARRSTLRLRLLVGSAAVLAMGGVWQWGTLRTEKAKEVGRLRTERAEEVGRLKVEKASEIADLTFTLSERELGRGALLHGERDAARHLANAYRRDRSPATEFMLARALQPRLAEQAQFVSSLGQMWTASFSPNGKQILTSDDTSAQIWDAESHKLLRTLAHGDTVFQAVYTPDGKQIVTACNDGAVRIWAAESGALVRELRHEGPLLRYYALAVAPSGRLVAAIDVTGAVAHVWNIGTGALLAELRNDSSAFPSVAFSADGQLLATTGGAVARVFDVRTWAPLASVPAVRCMSWDPTGPRLLTGSVKGDVSIWELPSGKRVHHLRDLGESVTVAAYAPDGQLVVAASRDGTEQVWNASSGELQSQGNVLHGPVRSIEFDPHSQLTVAAGFGGSVAVLDARLGMPVSVLDGPRGIVAAVHFDSTARRVIGASWDGTARIWGSDAPYRRWSSPPIQGCHSDAGADPDARVVAVSCENLSTQIWDPIRGEKLADLPGVPPAVHDLAWPRPVVSSTGERAAVARGAMVEVYKLPSGRLLRTIASGATVSAIAFGGHEQDLVVGAADGSLSITRDNGAQLTLPSVRGAVDVAGFLPDGRLVVSDAKHRLRVYDPRGTLLSDVETSARVWALRLSQDGRRAVTLPRLVEKSAVPELWDLEHGRLIAALSQPGQGYVWAGRFVAGGLILTASSDGAARLWDGSTGLLRQAYVGGSRFLADATLSPNGNMVVGGDADGLLRFWDAASGIPLWIMPAHRSRLVGLYMEGNEVVTRGAMGDIVRWTLPESEHVIKECRRNQLCATVLP